MWIAVTRRFKNFNENIVLTTAQIDDGSTKCRGITYHLNKAYWGNESEDSHRLLVGSWGKDTAVRPPFDVDMFFVLPNSVYFRIEALTGNKQSALLQEVKRTLEPHYPQTQMRSDGQVVQVGFNSLLIEVVPAFGLDDGRYRICDTNGGGVWKDVNPIREMRLLNDSNAAKSYNTKKLARMFKVWRDICNVPLDSYVIESVIVEYQKIVKWADSSFLYYDWLTRDFLEYLVSLASTYVWMLDGHLHWMGDSWKSRAESAWERSKKACDFERDDLVSEAGEEWQKIFGSWIEKNP